ncbi:MAG: right-handed parallel beta-helix repeat-containing protein, partial [Phycisphaerae bacterium]|nr:right-handed parallel beta-helix repeat-containing protein [Phycisphaerae bacterium]
MTTINDPMVQRGPWLSVVAVTAGGLLVGVAQADVVYVDHAAAGGGDGTSWAEAFASLSAALAASAPGDEIWVTGGGYGNVSLRGGIDVYGGFTGEEVERDERDWLANETTVGSVLATNETGTVRLDGFTTDHVTMSFADLELRNCHIAPSAPHELGAGLHAEDGGTLLLSECTVTDGEAEIGGALYVRDLSVVRLLDSTFIGNRATVGIGGVGIFRAETIEIAGCSFIDNDGGSSSGGLATGNGNAVQVIRDCRFIANRAEANAGGFGTSYGGLIVNCVFSRNSAEVGGGFIAASDEPIEMVNCSFSNNAGDGLCLNLGTSVSVANSVFWGNTPASLAGHVEGLTVNFSDVQGGWPGSANIDADPLFVQPGADDLRLGLGSPCLNAGNNPS